MNKILLIGIIFVGTCCSASEVKITKFKMETEYTKHQSESLVTKLNIEYRMNLYEPLHKKWIVYLGGKVNPDYNHFGRELKTNVFTTIGIDF